VLIALTRPVSPSLAACELTHLAREPIDVSRAAAQHAAYESVLASLHARIARAAAAPELPDAVFVEDTAIVLDEVAVIARPGAPSRRAETDAVAEVLAGFRSLLRLEAPATLDGGDVLRVGRELYVGLSSRSNGAAVEQLASLLRPFGYGVRAVPVAGCLHLKSAVTAVGERRLLLNPAWVARESFEGAEILCVDPSEPGAANALWLNGSVIYPAHFPRTSERLAQSGFEVIPVECSELAKAEGGVTCCSLLFRAD